MKYEQYVGNGTGPSPAKDPKAIQSDLDVIRHEMSQTLRELEDRISPQALMTEVVNRFRAGGDGASQFVRNLGNTVRDNPVPVLLIGAGVVSLAMSQRRGPTVHAYEEEGPSIGREALEKRAEGVREKAHDVKERASEKAHDVKERASEKAHDVKERASEMAGRVKERASGAQERVRATSARVREGAERARTRVREGTERARNTVDEQPLILVGLGLAAGAILGSLMPMSEPERRRLGPARDRLIESAKDTVEEAKEGLKEGMREGTEEPSPSLATESPWVGGEVRDTRPGLGIDTANAPGGTEPDIESKAPGTTDEDPLGGGDRRS